MRPGTNENTRRQPGVNTALISNNDRNVTPITDAVKAALLAGQSIRLIDYPPEDRQQVVGAIAALRDSLPIRAHWCTVRESFLNQTRLRCLRYSIPGEFLREDANHAV